MSAFYENEVKPWLDSGAKNEDEESLLYLLFNGETEYNRKYIPFDVKCVDHFGGEDMGSTYYSIIRFSNDDDACHVKFHGWYQSYVGCELDGYFEVVPETVTRVVTEYRKV